MRRKSRKNVPETTTKVTKTPVGGDKNVMLVWANNLDEELVRISSMKLRYNHIALAVTHPGNVKDDKFPPDERYFVEAVNQINAWPIIKIGFALYDMHGNIPKDQLYYKWVFNFKFNFEEYEQIDKKMKKSIMEDIDYQKHQKEGIDAREFGEKLLESNLAGSEDMRWLTFKGMFDFGLLVKTLTNSPLPIDEDEFIESFHAQFPKVYDVRQLTKHCRNLQMGLTQVASQMHVVREGSGVAAKACMIGSVFFAMRSRYFENMIEESFFNGRLYGIPKPPPAAE